MKILADQNMPLVEQFFKDMGEVERFDGRQLTPEQLIDVDVLLTRSVTQVDETMRSVGSRRRLSNCDVRWRPCKPATYLTLMGIILLRQLSFTVRGNGQQALRAVLRGWLIGMGRCYR